MSSLSSVQFSSNLSGIITCIKSDHYNTKVAASSTEGKISVFKFSKSEQPDNSTTFQAHNQAIWSLSWCHPKFGNYLASCSSDNTLKIWKEQSSLNFECVYEFDGHTDTITKCEFAPYQYGLLLVCSSLDGTISTHTLKQDWISKIHQKLHNNGITSFSWGPALPPINFQFDFENLYTNNNISQANNTYLPMRIMTCGGDGEVQIVQIESNDSSKVIYRFAKFKESLPIDIAWLNYVGYTEDTAAICFADKTVRIIKNEGSEEWTEVQRLQLNEECAKVSWSHCGAYLGVTLKNNKIKILQENLDGKWEEVNKDQNFGNNEIFNNQMG